MQVNPTVGVLYAQMNYASRAASDAAVGPEASLAMSRAIAQEVAKLEQKQVQAPEPTVEARITDEKNQERNSSKEFAEQENHAQDQDPEENITVSSDPLVGNLINMKI